MELLYLCLYWLTFAHKPESLYNWRASLSELVLWFWARLPLLGGRGQKMYSPRPELPLSGPPQHSQRRIILSSVLSMDISPQWKNLMQFSRAESRIKIWSFSDVSGSNWSVGCYQTTSTPRRWGRSLFTKRGCLPDRISLNSFAANASKLYREIFCVNFHYEICRLYFFFEYTYL